MNLFFRFIKKNGFYCIGICCLLPFLILSFFVHPVGTHGWDWATLYPGLLSPDLSFLDQQKYWYNNVMGRYSSTAILSLTPYWFSITSFKFFPFFSILVLFYSLFFLLKSIFFSLSSTKILLLTFGIFILYLDQLTSPYEAFYNLSCFFTYQFGVICFFFLAGLMIRILNDEKRKSFSNHFILYLLIFLAIGSNEVILIATTGWLSLLFLGKYYYYKKWEKWILALFIFSLICSFFEILAPGNFVRMELAPNTQNPILSIFLTLSVSIFNWIRWISFTPLLILAILYLPFGVQFAKKNNHLTFFQYPLFSIIGFISVHWVSLFLLFWSVGDEALPERIMDLLFWISLPLFLYTCQSLVFIFLEKKWIPLITSPFPKIVTYTLILFTIAHLFFKDLKIDKSEAARNTSNYISIIQTNSNIGNAWLNIFNGKAALYNHENYMLYQQITDCKSDTCFVKEFSVSPHFIYDKTFDRKAKNGEPYMSHYFGKKTIIIYEKD